MITMSTYWLLNTITILHQKVPRLPRETADFRARAGIVHSETETLYCTAK